jgi:hypothetical protein
VPRMTPPPPSLGAMVEQGDRRPKKQQPRPLISSRWLWVAVALVMAALVAFLMR